MNERQTDLLSDKPVVINIGVAEFYETLVDQSVRAVQVSWEPPAAGDEELMSLLDELL